MPEEDYKHRGTDAEGNPDDLLTEEEALEQASEEGIEFVDTFFVEGDESTKYKTAAAAKKAAKGKNVIQTRSRK